MTIKYRPAFKSIVAILFFFCHLSSFGQDTSCLNANKKVIIRYFDEVINMQKLNQMGEFFLPDYIWHQMNGTDVRRSQDSSHIAMLRWLFAAIPDVHFAIRADACANMEQ